MHGSSHGAYRSSASSCSCGTDLEDIENKMVSIQKQRQEDRLLRLEDRLEDNSISGISSSLYCACTLRVAAILEDMADFFAYLI